MIYIINHNHAHIANVILVSQPTWTRQDIYVSWKRSRGVSGRRKRLSAGPRSWPSASSPWWRKSKRSKLGEASFE